MSLVSKKKSSSSSKGVRLKWVPVKKAKSVKLTDDMTKGIKASSSGAQKKLKSSTDNQLVD